MGKYWVARLASVDLEVCINHAHYLFAALQYTTVYHVNIADVLLIHILLTH